MKDTMSEIWVSIKATNLVARRYKVAFSLKDLVNITSDWGVKNSKNCNARVKNTNLDEMFLTYNVRCKEKGSDPAGHTVKLRFDVDSIDDKANINNLDVKVSCSCPAFLYWGAQWNLSVGDALEGPARPLLQAPTDPRRFQNVLCKHLKVVADRINPFLTKLLAKYKDNMVQETLTKHEEAPSVKVVDDEDEETVSINKEPEKTKKAPVKEKSKPVKEKQDKTKNEVKRTNPVKSY